MGNINDLKTSPNQYRILLIDDLGGASNVVIEGSEQLLGANVVDALDSTSTGENSPFPVIEFISDGIHTLPVAWKYIENCNASDFHDVFLLDIRLDGQVSLTQRTEFLDLDNYEKYQVEELRKNIIDDLRSHQESSLKYYQEIEDMRSLTSTSKEDDNWIRSLIDVNKVKEKNRNLIEEILLEVDSKGDEVRTGKKIGFFSRGGLLLGELIRRTALKLNLPNEPIIIYYSGSAKARNFMLPQVISGREHLLIKGDYTFIPFVSGLLDEKSIEYLKRHLRTAERQDVIRKVLYYLENDFPRSEEKNFMNLILFENIFHGWTLASLFPSKVLNLVGSGLSNINSPYLEENEEGWNIFKTFLKSILPNLSSNTRFLFTSYPWKHFLHHSCQLGDKQKDIQDFKAWGWESQNIPEMIKKQDKNGYMEWSGKKVEEAVEELVGLCQPESNLFKDISKQQIIDTIKKRFDSHFDGQIGGKKNIWPFDSKHVRANIPDLIQDLFDPEGILIKDINGLSDLMQAMQLKDDHQIFYMPGIICPGFSLGKDGEILTDMKISSVYFFYITPEFIKYITNSSIPFLEDKSVLTIIKKIIVIFSIFFKAKIKVCWRSKQEPSSILGHERCQIELFGQLKDKNFTPGNLAVDSGVGEFSSMIFNSINMDGQSIGITGVTKNGENWSISWKDKKFYEGESHMNLEFPKDKDFCWIFSFLTYRKASR